MVLLSVNSAGGCDCTQSVAERSYPTSEVRGRSREDLMPKRQWPRGVTPRPRSGAAAESARLRWCRNGRGDMKDNPASKDRGRGLKEQPHIQGMVAVWAQEGPRGAIPCLRSGGVAVRRYPASKVRSSGCTLLEQP